MELRRLALALSVVVAACGGGPGPSIPWEVNLPPGGTVIYHVDHGWGVCGGSGCPTRIVQIGALCITETYQGEWHFRESKTCEAQP